MVSMYQCGQFFIICGINVSGVDCIGISLVHYMCVRKSICNKARSSNISSLTLGSTLKGNNLLPVEAVY